MKETVSGLKRKKLFDSIRLLEILKLRLVSNEAGLCFLIKTGSAVLRIFEPHYCCKTANYYNEKERKSVRQIQTQEK
jgi:hypothetical protein